MKNFNNFLNEADGDNKEKKSSKLFFSERFFRILNKINTNDVAKEFLKNEGKFVSNISWLDIDEEDSKNISFLTTDRAKRVENVDLDNFNPYSPLWTSTLRQKSLIGKIINKLFPEKFTNMDIDNFYNRYCPEIDSKKTKDKHFEIVRGNDIKNWYNEKMYNGKMGSCMRYDKCAPYFNMYCENPEKVGLLIYLDETGKKAYGRALVWFGLLKPSGDTIENKESYTLLDRVYTVEGKSRLTAMFTKYAIDNGWIYKEGEMFMMNGQKKTTSVTIRLKPKNYGKYPYLDTMQYFTPTTGRASSTPGNAARDPNDSSKVFSRYKLRRQDGGYDKID